MIALAIVPSCSWLIVEALVKDGISYLHTLTYDNNEMSTSQWSLAYIMERVLTNIRWQPAHLTALWLAPFDFRIYPPVVNWLGVFLVITGFVLRSSRMISVVEGYIAVYIAILFMWPPVYANIRFFVPIVPFLAGYVYYCIKEVSSAINMLLGLPGNPRLSKIAISGAAMVAIVVNIPYRISLTEHECGICPEYEAAIELASHVPANAKVWCDDEPLAIQLISNRNCREAPRMGLNPAELNEFSHRLITRTKESALADAITWDRVATGRDWILYERRRSQ